MVPVKSNSSAEVIVIGGGVFGCAVAYHLAVEGVDAAALPAAALPPSAAANVLQSIGIRCTVAWIVFMRDLLSQCTARSSRPVSEAEVQGIASRRGPGVRVIPAKQH